MRKLWPGCLVVLVPSFPLLIVLANWTLYQYRAARFASAVVSVNKLNASLSFDLVDGNYVLGIKNDSLDDSTISKIVEQLEALPTGFTFVGPGEDRNYWIHVTGNALTDSSLNKLGKLAVADLIVESDELSDASIPVIMSMKQLWHLDIDGSLLTDEAVALLRSSKTRTIIEIRSAKHNPK